MTATVLNVAGLDPTVVVGGKAASMGGSNARVGQSDFLVVESDESDGSFLKLSPILAVVTNIDREHLDHYPSIAEIRAAFLEFIQKVPFYGAAVLCLDDENVQQILPSVNRRVITYGRSQQATLHIAEVDCGAFESRFSIRMRGHDLGSFHLRVPGVHNVLNATAAIAVGLELDVKLESIREALASYSGVDRRFQTRGQARGVTVIDDYGHHPTEIRATLAAAQLCGFKRVLVIFQPHRYTRTQHLMDEFAKSFHQADLVYVLDIYAASERPIEGVDGRALADRIREFGHRCVHYAGTIPQTVDAVLEKVRPEDVVLTLGAGNVWQAGDLLLEKLREAS
jgi:UDP-N-acetylmuramate--alanine ligase